MSLGFLFYFHERVILNSWWYCSGVGGSITDWWRRWQIHNFHINTVDWTSSRLLWQS